MRSIALLLPKSVRLLAICLCTTALAGLFLTSALSAQDSTPAVQANNGYLDLGDSDIYLASDLKAGQTLYVYMANMSGNLDPFLAVFPADVNPDEIRTAFQTGLAQALADGVEPYLALAQAADSVALAWADDTGSNHNAALTFQVPADGDYRLLVGSSLNQETFGGYRLLAGIDTPTVLDNTARPAGKQFLELDSAAMPVRSGVEVVTGTLTTEKQQTFYELRRFDAGDTLDVHFAPTSGDLKLTTTLADFGDKPLVLATADGGDNGASLHYVFPSDAANYQLLLTACCGPEAETSGDYRLVVGRNAPDAATGNAEPGGRSVLYLPTPVEMGVRMQQITAVDQKAENFGVQATLRMAWNDPALAFNPDSCKCSFKSYNGDSFKEFVSASGGRWPEFTLANQQNNRWIQNRAVVVYPNGDAIYLERFSTTLQAPDFDFRKFPFDKQDFYIRVAMLYPEEFYVLEDDPAYSQVGSTLGEEEWYITDWDVAVAQSTASTISAASEYAFHFEAERHLNYYFTRLFIPLGLILLISWITLFLSNYTRRIEATSANLLLFIAWNFSIASDLPRLGYLTFMDMVMLTTFVVTVSIIVYNVILRRLETGGREGLARRIDRYAIWAYPLIYLWRALRRGHNCSTDWRPAGNLAMYDTRELPHQQCHQ